MDPIKLNPSVDTQLNIELDIKGVSDPKMRVLFCIDKLYQGVGDVYFDCVRDEDGFSVSIPAMPNLVGQSSVPFRIVVIADGYYFEPTTGELSLVAPPKTKVSTKSTKPKSEEEEVVDQEGDGIVTSQKMAGHAVVPEVPFPESNPKFGNSDDDIDVTKLESQTEAPFDPAKEVKSIISKTIGGFVRVNEDTTKPGALRKRYNNRQLMPERDQVVIDIINSTKTK